MRIVPVGGAPVAGYSARLDSFRASSLFPKTCGDYIPNTSWVFFVRHTETKFGLYLYFYFVFIACSMVELAYMCCVTLQMIVQTGPFTQKGRSVEAVRATRQLWAVDSGC
jgi:hypothetical protein